jgi:AraC-like DNA-binding protein
VLKGGLKYSNTGEPAHIARKGDIACSYPGIGEFCVLEGEPLTVYSVDFLPSNKAQYAAGIPYLPGVGRIPCLLRVGDNTQPFIDSYERIIQAMMRLGPAWQIEASSATLDLISKIFRSMKTHTDASVPRDRWDRLISHVEDGLDTPTVQEMARKEGMSPRQFTREFTKHVGKTPKQYILQRRLWNAREELRKGYSVKDVAYAYGFHSPLYFSRAYKLRFGYPPTKTPLNPTPVLPESDSSLPYNRLLFAPGVTRQTFQV